MNFIAYLWNYHKFKRAFYGLTLNSIGPLYGVQRIKGESHRSTTVESTRHPST